MLSFTVKYDPNENENNENQESTDWFSDAMESATDGGLGEDSLDSDESDAFWSM